MRGRPNRKRMADVPSGQETPLDYAVSTRDAGVLSMVTEAIAHKQVLLAYQPVVLATDTESHVFYEGLLRVLDETGRTIPAKDFMGVVEAQEAGRQLDCLALEHGLATLAAQPELRISINMSARSIGYKRWTKSLERGLARTPGISGRLILEISESSVLQVPELVMDFMDDLHAKGIAFALDDFGAHLTSLGLLQDMFFDLWKLDSRFTRKIRADRDNQIMASGLAAIARACNILMVAGRVEHPADASVLNELGFDCLQGFLFGSPTVTPHWAGEKGPRRRSGRKQQKYA